MENFHKILIIIAIVLGGYIILCNGNTSLINKDKKNNSKSTEIQENMNTEKTQVCFFWASWCGHCQDTKPKWEEMKKMVTKNIEINEINCEGDNTDKCKIYLSGKEEDIEGLPTITIRKLDSNNKVIKEVEYNNEPDKGIEGSREPEDLIKFIKHYSDKL